MSEHKPQKILVIGAGCIGIYLGTKLAKAGHQVSLFGRRKLGQLGETIFIDQVPFEIPEKLFDLPTNQHFDLIFITTKLYHLLEALSLLNQHKITSDHLYSIQNGLVDENVYKGLLGNKKMTIISVFEGIQIQEDKITVSATGLGWKTEASTAGKLAAKLFTNARIPCVADDHLLQIRTEKTIVNCCLNVLSAVEEKHFFELFADPKIFQRIQNIFDECYAVFTPSISLEPKELLWGRLVSGWSRTHHFSSTYQDLISGRETEIEFLTGYILGLSKLHHIPVPENENLYGEFMHKLSIRN